ncbi:FluG domain-containing protein [Histoplasma capsulatum var. duboisii H88]|uniref:FluG domain-containing protein n=1 Tax=Ajellomyces capsulatus (strain H88) TaxID=544711 RepID=F0UL33_AJEC8|nr:FluG domain-containing protein [Histoplasma capsulatum var. duboisii H88]
MPSAIRILCYWHVLVMEVSLLFMKGKQNKSQLEEPPTRLILLQLLWDVQSAYLGCPVRESIIQTVGRFSLICDSCALKELSNEQKDAIEWDSWLIKLCGQQCSLHKLIERKHGSLSKGKGTELYHQYTELGDTIRAEKQALHCEVFDGMRQEFFATIDTIEIERQLLGLPVSKKLKMDDENNDWVALCSLREGSCKRKVSSTDSETDFAVDGIIDADTFPITCPGTQCLFCLGDSQLPHSARMYSFSQPDHLQRHVQACHLRYLDPDALLWCPHPSCPDVVDGVKDFQGHALLVHNVYV